MGIYNFGNNTYPQRIGCTSTVGHIFRGKKCVLWARKYSNCNQTDIKLSPFSWAALKYAKIYILIGQHNNTLSQFRKVYILFIKELASIKGIIQPNFIPVSGWHPLSLSSASHLPGTLPLLSLAGLLDMEFLVQELVFGVLIAILLMQVPWMSSYEYLQHRIKVTITCSSIQLHAV